MNEDNLKTRLVQQKIDTATNAVHISQQHNYNIIHVLTHTYTVKKGRCKLE